MKHAFTLLGLACLIVFGVAGLIFNRAHAPANNGSVTPANSQAVSNMSMTLTSIAFADGGQIPSRFTCDGENVHPPLSISGVPSGTKSLVLVMDDSDIPESIKQDKNIEKFNHWAVFNLSANVTDLPTGDNLGSAAFNSTDQPGYIGPCPPSDLDPLEHRYIFRLYALPEMLDFEHTPDLDELEARAKKSALESATLMGLSSRTTD